MRCGHLVQAPLALARGWGWEASAFAAVREGLASVCTYSGEREGLVSGEPAWPVGDESSSLRLRKYRSIIGSKVTVELVVATKFVSHIVHVVRWEMPCRRAGSRSRHHSRCAQVVCSARTLDA